MSEWRVTARGCGIASYPKDRFATPVEAGRSFAAARLTDDIRDYALGLVEGSGPFEARVLVTAPNGAMHWLRVRPLIAFDVEQIDGVR